MSIMEMAPAQVDPIMEPEEPKEAHIVRREDQMRGYVSGEPIRALCGKVWVPSENPHDLPVCPRCKSKKEQIIAGQRGMN